jgi:hypothetical protein
MTFRPPASPGKIPSDSGADATAALEACNTSIEIAAPGARCHDAEIAGIRLRYSLAAQNLDTFGGQRLFQFVGGPYRFGSACDGVGGVERQRDSSEPVAATPFISVLASAANDPAVCKKRRRLHLSFSGCMQVFSITESSISKLMATIEPSIIYSYVSHKQGTGILLFCRNPIWYKISTGI